MSSPMMSRRSIAKGSLFAGATTLLASSGAHAQILGGITPKKYTHEIVCTGSKDVRVEKIFTPDKLPIDGSWYQQIRARYDVSGKTYVGGVISSDGGSNISAQIEFMRAGRKQIVATKSVPAIVHGVPFAMYVTVKGDEIKLTLWQKKVQIIRLVAPGVDAFTADVTENGVYTNCTNVIDFHESLTVTPLSIVQQPTNPVKNGDATGHINHAGFSLVLDEQFSGSRDTLDKKIWTIRDSGNWAETGKTGPGSANWPSVNNNATCIDQAQNVDISNGTAKIWVKPLPIPRQTPYKDANGVRKTTILTHSAGYLDTKGKLEQHYGRWEIRSKSPVGPKRAVWGGLWLMGVKSYPLANDEYWEVDINEGYGKNEYGRPGDPVNRADSTIHFAKIGHELTKAPYHKKVSSFSPQGRDNFENEWHVWAVEITPTGIEFFFDDEPVPYHALYAKDHPVLKARLADPKQLFSIRLNLMTGCPWWNKTDTPEEMAKPLEVDYVRVWKYVG